MQNLFSTVKLIAIAALVLAALILAPISSQAANVILDGDNVTRIENLEVVDLLGNTTFYNVDFVDDTAIGVYGTEFDFDFPIAGEAAIALDTVHDALNSNNPIPSGAGPQGSDQFFIGTLKFAGLVYSVGGENKVGLWGDCEVDCLNGFRTMRDDTTFTWADFTVVSGPAPVTIGGSVTGLVGSGLVLQNNGGDDKAIAGNGAFTFDTPMTPGGFYNVTVAVDPSNPAQTCSVANGSGTVPNQPVTDVAVVCAPPAADTAFLPAIYLVLGAGL